MKKFMTFKYAWKNKLNENMKINVDKVQKPDVHLINVLRRTSRRSSKNGNSNRRGMCNTVKPVYSGHAT